MNTISGFGPGNKAGKALNYLNLGPLDSGILSSSINTISGSLSFDALNPIIDSAKAIRTIVIEGPQQVATDIKQDIDFVGQKINAGYNYIKSFFK